MNYLILQTTYIHQTGIHINQKVLNSILYSIYIALAVVPSWGEWLLSLLGVVVAGQFWQVAAALVALCYRRRSSFFAQVNKDSDHPTTKNHVFH